MKVLRKHRRDAPTSKPLLPTPILLPGTILPTTCHFVFFLSFPPPSYFLSPIELSIDAIPRKFLLLLSYETTQVTLGFLASNNS